MSDIREYQSAVDIIKTAILKSQARATKGVNQEQLALYYGIGRYVSENTRKKYWGQGAIEAISNQLRKELSGLRGFSATSMRNMRTFYEEWKQLESNSSVATDEIQTIHTNSSVVTDEITASSDNSAVTTSEFAKGKSFVPTSEICQLQLANLPDFPLREFLGISFTHHITILAKAKAYDERVFYMRYADTYKSTVEDLEKVIKQDLYHHQDKMPNNFLSTIPDYKKAYRAIRMFKDEYLLDYINVEELGMRNFKVAYLAQLSAYLRILNDDDRRDHEEAPIGIILCKNADKNYAGYIMQDFLQPMGVATYKTADEIDPELLKALPPKEELQRVFEESSNKED